jgi:hypothetical protein
MGTWGHKAFENDGASDWAWTLKNGGLTAVESALDAVLAADDYLEAPLCENAVAASEALCVLLGKPASTIPEDVTKWAAQEKKKPSDLIIGKARKSIEKISEKSELRDLWEESDEFASWQGILEGIKQRLPNVAYIAASKPWWKIW